jgi:SAM-dependent methyltransferase
MKCFCNATETRPFAEGIDECASCGTLRTEPRAGYATKYTEGTDYHLNRAVPYTERFEHDQAVAALRLPKLLANLRVLDVGCANGGFIAQAAAQGFSAEGLEPNPTMARFAAKQTGCLIHLDWSSVHGWFDLLTYHDVIEHLPNPVGEVLDAIRTHLRPGGLLILDTPDRDQLDTSPHHIRLDEHVWYFSAASLSLLIRLCGLELLSIDYPIPGKIVAYARRHQAGT